MLKHVFYHAYLAAKICTPGYCKNGGTCIVVGTKPFCQCPLGYLPPDCVKHVITGIFSIMHFVYFILCFIPFTELMNTINSNWLASSVWVFIAQLVEHCSANAEATGSKPVEAPKTFFGLLPNWLNCDSLR